MSIGMYTYDQSKSGTGQGTHIGEQMKNWLEAEYK